MNGQIWTVRYAHPYDPNLIDRTHSLRVATTDPITRTVFLSNELAGNFLKTVLIHELGHCALWSYGLLDDIHRVVPEKYWIEAEEWACNFLADYGEEVLKISQSILSVPYNFDKAFSQGRDKNV